MPLVSTATHCAIIATGLRNYSLTRACVVKIGSKNLLRKIPIQATWQHVIKADDELAWWCS
jgi:hypothetical protein